MGPQDASIEQPELQTDPDIDPHENTDAHESSPQPKSRVFRRVDEFTDELSLQLVVASDRVTSELGDEMPREGALLNFICSETKGRITSAVYVGADFEIRPRRDTELARRVNGAFDLADVIGVEKAIDKDDMALLMFAVGSDDPLEVHLALASGSVTGVTVDVRLRFDEKPVRNVTWGWSERLAVPLGDFDRGNESKLLLRDSRNGERLIVSVHRSPTFRFDLAKVREDIIEFEDQCMSWAAKEDDVEVSPD